MKIRTPLALGFALLVLLLPACGSDSSGPPDQIAQDLERILQDGLQKSGALGAVIEVAAPDWTWRSAAGLSSTTPPVAAAPDMYFRMASVSKLTTAIAVMRLIQDGRMSLDDPVERWLPVKYLERMPYYRQITMRMLLQHRSGLADYNETDSLIPQQMAQPDVPLSTDTAIVEGLDQTASPPDRGFEYSNPNYLLLAMAIDAAAGVSYERYLNERIFARVSESDMFTMTAPPVKPLPQPGMRCLSRYPDPAVLSDFTDLYINWDRGAGDIVTSAGGMNRLHRALREGRLIDRALLAEMETLSSPMPIGFLPVPDAAAAYGLGYIKIRSGALDVTLVGHEGGYPGSTTYAFYLAECDIYFTFNMNGSPQDENQHLLLPLVQYLRQLHA